MESCSASSSILFIYYLMNYFQIAIYRTLVIVPMVSGSNPVSGVDVFSGRILLYRDVRSV